MTKRIADPSQRKAAKVAGLAYVLIIVLGILKGIFLEANLIVSGNDAATANNILANESLFRIGIAGDVIMILCDVALALLFYLLLRPVNNSLALLAAFFRLAQAVTLGVNLLNLFFLTQKLIFHIDKREYSILPLLFLLHFHRYVYIFLLKYPITV